MNAPLKDWVMVFHFNDDVTSLPNLALPPKVGWKLPSIKPLMVFLVRKTLGV